ncbi:MAG: NAD(P)/FAD-dependent oxidoreductase [Saprospiraceae bacterium]|nr:NAD(P)/FAD-dependent oxidoreductase [Saprospiraceae bacterium]
MSDKNIKIIVVGGGAAGFFAAIRCAELNPNAEVTILERGRNVLEKVKISGGGRCNVTHACWAPAELVKHYPRGERELLGPFHRFACGDTIDWFEKRGVELKIEEDGRMFPVSDDSQTIIDCLWDSAVKAGVKVQISLRVDDFVFDEKISQWKITSEENIFIADKVLVASGSNPRIWEMLKTLGHTIVEPVPSLFTFNIKDERIRDLPGISVPEAFVQIKNSKLSAKGPLLITHWGMSGPAILKLSAWGARELASLKYSFTIEVNWLNQKPTIIQESLNDFKSTNPKKQVFANALFGLSIRLWKSLVLAANIPEEKKWADISKKELQMLVNQLCTGEFIVNGKSTFKEEFVTAGGVDLKEVNFKTFESKLFPGLYFAGEVLNIDATTGGFNFQAAWTGGWIAGEAMVLDTEH